MEASEKPAAEDRSKETTAAVAEGTGIDDFDDFDSFLETVLSDCDEPGTAAVAQAAAVKPSSSNPEKGHDQQDARGQEGVNGEYPKDFEPGSGGIANVPLTAADMESTCTTGTPPVLRCDCAYGPSTCVYSPVGTIRLPAGRCSAPHECCQGLLESRCREFVHVAGGCFCMVVHLGCDVRLTTAD